MKTTLSSAVVGDSLSALVDGELRGEEFAQVLAACEIDSSLLASWQDYHLIGDALRSSDLSVMRSSAPFLARLQSRLSDETRQPNVSSVVEISALSAPHAVISPMLEVHSSANDPVFRWKMVAGFASMTAVAVMVWTLAVSTGDTGSQLAQGLLSPSHQVSAAVLIPSPQGAILRDARLDELLAAHRQVGGNSALQMPSGFLRNATFETSQNASNARR
jgi:sigma-E factor negative regulatory protein RseA